MASLLARIKGGRQPERLSIDDYAQMLSQYQFSGLSYATGPLVQTLGGERTERPADSFEGLASAAYSANGIVFACMLVRQLVFSSIRFQYQRFNAGKPADTFGDKTLRVLERPWPGGTTQDLLSRMIQDADLAGNSYWVRQDDELVRLRPDWVQIVGQPRTFGTADSGRGGGQVGWIKRGYLYTEGGFRPGNPNESVAFSVDEVAHWAPIPDPLGIYCGISWLTPIVREIQNDQSMTRHKRKFFDNGATVNMIIKHGPMADPAAVMKWSDEMQAKHGGTENAYKNLNLYPGADATVVGSNMKDIDFRNVQGAGETRIAAAAGVPPVIAGFSEGLAAATYSNYGQARRRFADGTIHPLWQNAAGSVEMIVPPPDDGSRLWYDATDVPFLREDEKDAAEIAETRARTIRTYVDGGYEPASVIAAVDANDSRLLKHTGWFSVQLQQPGATTAPPPAPAQPKRVASSRDVLQIELIPREALAIEAPAETEEVNP